MRSFLLLLLTALALLVQKPEFEVASIKPSAPDASGVRAGVHIDGSGGATVNCGHGSYFTFGNNRVEGRKLSAPLMVDLLARFTDRPVVDMTNLKGNYDFTLELSTEDFRAMGIRAAMAAGVALPPQAIQMAEAASGDSLMSAVEKLGLKLESRKAPIEVLVIDHAEKTPAEN